jgi:hypothetical protein
MKGGVEKRILFVTSPWWDAPLTRIAPSPKAAIVRHDQMVGTEALRMYTDGSAINGRIGAAAYAPQLGARIKKYLGRSTHYIFYSGELEGIDIACQIALFYGAPEVIIFTENVVSIEATACPKVSSGHYILRRICAKITKLSELGFNVGFRPTKESKATK